MTSTTTKKRPSYELFSVENHGDHSPATWTKVGVAFRSKSDKTDILFVGPKGDPKTKRYLKVDSSQFDVPAQRAADEPRRIPVAKLYELTEGQNIDFRRNDGVCFLNRDSSYSVLIGDKADPEQVRLQMRPVK
jgi:hypothetical protein